ncbi:2Fe-2S iron-sulfur cluster-binding protein [Spongisporangium articulatum]|uniref:2Fe-2S iron-sulfur cluster-binding protein n=1 Tax=Spongisporangium articulatum TaxID=3362603 RepID=A0ABW8AUJ8_9ACTN
MSRIRRVRVAAVKAETADARSVTFDVEPGDARWFRARPGQFLTVRVPVGDGDRRVARCYSLSNGPDDDPTITVKRAGPGSAWICDELRPGDELELLPPAGRFTPRSPDTDLLLVAAGSGITPVMSILRWVLGTGYGHVALLYANRDAEAVIFERQLRLLDVRHPGRLSVTHWLESERGLPTAEALAPLLGPYAERETYLCGPEPFMAAVEAAQASLGGQRNGQLGRLHVERYESLTEDPFVAAARADAEDERHAAERATTPDEPAEVKEEPADDVPPESTAGATVVEVEFDGDKHRLPWTPGRPLLEVLEAAGIAAPFSCREGNCGACACLVLEGRMTMRRNETLTPEDLADGYVLACQADPDAPLVRVSYDE